MQPRTTVLIPTYNRAHWLGGAIESVLSQTWTDFRLVVSDNASTDETRETVARYTGDQRVSYVRRDHNVDLNTHFNLCFDELDTEFAFVLPDDDRMAADLLEVTIPELDANPRAGMVHGQVTVVGEHGEVIAEGHGMTDLTADTVETGEEFIRRSMAKSYRVHASTALIRTAALAGIRLDPRDYPVTDLGLWMRMALDWEIAYLARPLATYRVHPTAYSASDAAITHGGYSESTQRVLRSYDVKLRLIEEHAAQLGDTRGLRSEARRRFRAELVASAAEQLVPERRFASTVRTLGWLCRLDARVALMPTAWKLLAGSVIGHRGVSVVKRVLRRPRTSLEVPA